MLGGKYIMFNGNTKMFSIFVLFYLDFLVLVVSIV
jgi:hypothetical protein